MFNLTAEVLSYKVLQFIVRNTSDVNRPKLNSKAIVLREYVQSKDFTSIQLHTFNEAYEFQVMGYAYKLDEELGLIPDSSISADKLAEVQVAVQEKLAALEASFAPAIAPRVTNVTEDDTDRLIKVVNDPTTVKVRIDHVALNNTKSPIEYTKDDYGNAHAFDMGVNFPNEFDHLERECAEFNQVVSKRRQAMSQARKSDTKPVMPSLLTFQALKLSYGLPARLSAPKIYTNVDTMIDRVSYSNRLQVSGTSSNTLRKELGLKSKKSTLSIIKSLSKVA